MRCFVCSRAFCAIVVGRSGFPGLHTKTFASPPEPPPPSLSASRLAAANICLTEEEEKKKKVRTLNPAIVSFAQFQIVWICFSKQSDKIPERCMNQLLSQTGEEDNNPGGRRGRPLCKRLLMLKCVSCRIVNEQINERGTTAIPGFTQRAG